MLSRLIADYGQCWCHSVYLVANLSSFFLATSRSSGFSYKRRELTVTKENWLKRIGRLARKTGWKVI